MTSYIKFDTKYDSAKLIAELDYCANARWRPHFNTQDYQGEWDCIALRSRSGDSSDIGAICNGEAYVDTDLLQQLSYLPEVIDSIPGVKESVRLMALYPNSEIKPHRDLDCSYRDGIYRIHIPICTHPDVEFYLDGERIVMQPGECWYLDFSKTHQIVNRSHQIRVHLVIDGIRDAETDRYFFDNGYQESARPGYDEQTKLAMIANLEMMDTDTARELIARLKSELQNG